MVYMAARVSYVIFCLIIFDINMTCFEWFKMESLVQVEDLIKKSKENTNRNAKRKPQGNYPYSEQFSMKQFYMKRDFKINQII